MTWHIAAHILVPPDFNEGHKYPTVVALQARRREGDVLSKQNLQEE
jgi:hypothetical protein